MKVKLSNQKDIKVVMSALYTRKNYLESMLINIENKRADINRKEHFKHELKEVNRVLTLFEKIVDND